MSVFKKLCIIIKEYFINLFYNAYYRYKYYNTLPSITESIKFTRDYFDEARIELRFMGNEDAPLEEWI